MRPVPLPPLHRPRRAVIARRGAAAVVIAGFSATLAPDTVARPRDPTTTHVLFAKGVRAAPDRRGARDDELPDGLELLWQARVPGTIGHPPIVTAEGSLVVASTAGVTEIDPDGARVYARAFGPAAPVTSPAIAPDGSRMVVTSRAELVLLTPSGALRAGRRLPVDATTVMPTLVVTGAGTLLVGASDSVLEVTLEGDVLARISLPSAPVSLLELGDRRLVVTTTGDVLQWRVTDPPRRLGSFGGPVNGAVALTPDGELVAVVDRTRLVSLDPRDGTLRIRLVVTGFTLPAPPALTRDAETRVLTSTGQVLAHDRHGRELMRWSIDGAAPGGGARARPTLRSEPPAPLVGADGRVAVAWPDRGPVLIDPDGRVVSADDVSCERTIALLPMPDHTVALVCASGVVSRLGDPPSPRVGPGN